MCVACPQGLREITQQDGALLCFDEVMTGFRISKVCALPCDPLPVYISFALAHPSSPQPLSPIHASELRHIEGDDTKP